jgi:hypothetical protein
VLDELFEKQRTGSRSLRRCSGRAEPVGCSHIRLLPTNPPGDWTGVLHTLLGENNGCEEEEGREEGGEEDEVVGPLLW